MRVNTTRKGINQWAPELGVKMTTDGGYSISIDGRAELNGQHKNYFTDLKLDYLF